MDWTRVLWTNMAQENSGSVMAVFTRITLYVQNCWDDDARMQSWGAMREIVCNLLFIKIRNLGENLPLWDGFQTHFLIPCHSFWVRGHGFPILPQLEGKTTTWSNGFTNQTARNSLSDTHTCIYIYLPTYIFSHLLLIHQLWILALLTHQCDDWPQFWARFLAPWHLLKAIASDVEGDDILNGLIWQFSRSHGFVVEWAYSLQTIASQKNCDISATIMGMGWVFAWSGTSIICKSMIQWSNWAIQFF